MVVVSSFSKIEVTFSCQGSSFFQALMILATETKDYLYYARAGGRADDKDCRERARRFIHCRCFGDQCPVLRVVHKGQHQAFFRASASLLNALVVHLNVRLLLYFLQRGQPSFYFDLP